jgi:hypothetical protein
MNEARTVRVDLELLPQSRDGVINRPDRHRYPAEPVLGALTPYMFLNQRGTKYHPSIIDQDARNAISAWSQLHFRDDHPRAVRAGRTRNELTLRQYAAHVC